MEQSESEIQAYCMYKPSRVTVSGGSVSNSETERAQDIRKSYQI